MQRPPLRSVPNFVLIPAMTSGPTLGDQLDDLLPQTQCRQCGFDGCRPYADAMAHGQADIDRCPPGGDAGIVQLAALLHRPIIPLDTTRGQPGPLTVAVIEEKHCIGCTLCIAACPVDAILGANKRMHTVLPDACTGCGLCVPPCPVDCIQMVPVAPARAWTPADARKSRLLHRNRLARLARDEARANAKRDDTPQALAALAISATPSDALNGAPMPHAVATAADAASPTEHGQATAPSARAQGAANATPVTSTADSAAARKAAVVAAALARARARRGDAGPSAT